MCLSHTIFCRTMIKELLLILLQISMSKQGCPAELTYNGFTVEWPETPSGSEATSTPVCLGADEHIITRKCVDSEWIPSNQRTPSCYKIVTDFSLNSCPPGYSAISENSTDYCYQVSEATSWNYPCLTSGGAAVITELSDYEIESLLKSLHTTESSRYFWLPAQRSKVFNPLVWTIPGQQWGRRVEGTSKLQLIESIFSNCLLLDVQEHKIVSEFCYNPHPNLCFFINELQYPALCPQGYHAFRFMPHKGTCYGIDYSDRILGSTFDEFLSHDCTNPMGDSENETRNLLKFIFVKIAQLSNLPSDHWCWFESSYTDNGTHLYTQDQNHSTNNSLIATEVNIANMQGIINNEGVLALMNANSRLPCIACEKEITYNEPQILLEYNDVDQKMYLTIYHPSGLWKDDTTDKGIRCFSDAKGFVEVIDVNDEPYINVNHSNNSYSSGEIHDKIVYLLYPVTDRSAQYWCEGHLQNFSLLSSKKIVVSPKTINEHVFALVVKVPSDSTNKQVFPDFSETLKNISDLFHANKVLLMDFLNYTTVEIICLLHLHVPIDDSQDSLGSILSQKYREMVTIAENELSIMQMTYINMSSCTNCLPVKTEDGYELDWELTKIDQITAPSQFCLQSNGLPVKRRCSGSYLLGAKWEKVDGTCSGKYIATNTTTYLYKTARGEISTDSTSTFMTEGLSYVLEDLNIIIPADIFYLSMSLQYILHIANQNNSNVDMGDIHNIAWAMDRVMNLDWSYLRLAQTLNSSNVILDSLDNIIETILNQDHLLKSNTNENLKSLQCAINPQFLVQVSYPAYNNITGLALANRVDGNSLIDTSMYPLFGNTSLDEILNIENLEIATWISDDMLKSLKINTNDNTTISDPSQIHIIISIFDNDAIFQQIDMPNFIVNGRILGISIPGYLSNLERPITLIYRDSTEFNNISQQVCGYWNFNSQAIDSAPGYWANEGCFFIKKIKTYTICECYHLTHFGQLLSFNRESNVEDEYPQAESRYLNIITLCGCFLSLLGIVGIWVTAIVFRSWRKKAGTKVLLQLSTAIALPLILILIFNLDIGIFHKSDGVYSVNDNMKILCIFLGSSLHYSILASFMWMLITAVLQFIRYVRVLGVQRPARFMMKFTVLGWGVPIIPVLLTITINKETYVPLGSWYEKPLCYPTGYSFIFAVILPITAILIVNVVLFLLVMYSISRGPDGKFRATDIDLIGAQFRLSIFLFFLLGLTWIFGLFSFSENGFTSYLFVFTSTLQGFLLFVYFVICDPATRSLWVTLMKPQFKHTSSRESISSIYLK